VRRGAYFLVNFTDLSFLACAVFFKEAVWSACFSGSWGVCNKLMFMHRCQYAYVEELVRVAVGNLDAVARVSVRLCLRACSGCGTPFPKIGFGVSTLMLKGLFGLLLVTSMPCAGVSTLMFRACSGENARRQ